MTNTISSKNVKNLSKTEHEIHCGRFVLMHKVSSHRLTTFKYRFNAKQWRCNKALFRQELLQRNALLICDLYRECTLTISRSDSVKLEHATHVSSLTQILHETCPPEWFNTVLNLTIYQWDTVFHFGFYRKILAKYYKRI